MKVAEFKFDVAALRTHSLSIIIARPRRTILRAKRDAKIASQSVLGVQGECVPALQLHTYRSRCLRFMDVVIRDTPVKTREVCKQEKANGCGDLQRPQLFDGAKLTFVLRSHGDRQNDEHLKRFREQ